MKISKMRPISEINCDSSLGGSGDDSSSSDEGIGLPILPETKFTLESLEKRLTREIQSLMRNRVCFEREDDNFEVLKTGLTLNNNKSFTVCIDT